MNNTPSVPIFAVVGQPNEGKTSVVATLTEDDRALISWRSGTTQDLMRYPVVIDHAEVMETARRVRGQFVALLEGIIDRLA